MKSFQILSLDSLPYEKRNAPSICCVNSMHSGWRRKSDLPAFCSLSAPWKKPSESPQKNCEDLSEDDEHDPFSMLFSGLKIPDLFRKG